MGEGWFEEIVSVNFHSWRKKIYQVEEGHKLWVKIERVGEKKEYLHKEKEKILKATRKA
jgi:hypothetical protein